MAVDIAVSAEIERPVAQVAGFACDPANAPRWYRRIHSAEILTDPPVAVGTRTEFRARFLGRALVYTYEIVQFEPERSLTMTTAEGPFPMTTEYTWSPTGEDRTTMTLRNHGTPSGFSVVAAPVMTRAMRRAMTGDLADLKSLLENGSTA